MNQRVLKKIIIKSKKIKNKKVQKERERGRVEGWERGHFGHFIREKGRNGIRGLRG